MVERLAILRIATKHINIWIRQLEMKRGERAGGVDEAWRNQEGDYEEVPRTMGKKMLSPFHQEGEKNVVWGDRQHGVER